MSATIRRRARPRRRGNVTPSTTAARAWRGRRTAACTKPPRDASPSDESYLSTMSRIYAACARMLAPGRFLVIVTKNLRANGALRNLTVALCQHAGLDYWQPRRRPPRLPSGSSCRPPQRARDRQAHPLVFRPPSKHHGMPTEER
jgi:hypothetical protein